MHCLLPFSLSFVSSLAALGIFHASCALQLILWALVHGVLGSVVAASYKNQVNLYSFLRAHLFIMQVSQALLNVTAPVLTDPSSTEQSRSYKHRVTFYSETLHHQLVI